MRLRLTRKLQRVGLMLIVALGIQLPAFAEGNSLASDEPARYLSELRKLYLTKDDRTALLAHSNALLQSYALRAGYQIGSSAPRDLLYSLSLGEPGELLVREEVRSEGRLQVRTEPVNLFGVDPFIRYDCPSHGIVCEIRHPADGSVWLTLVRDHKGAAEVAKALSFLIRNLQKG